MLERADGSFLLAERPRGKPYAGYWEFPGGKIEAGESALNGLTRELHDQILRLDRVIGSMLDSVFKLRDPSTVVVALTADHGVTPYPEIRHSGAAAAAMHVDLWDMFVATTLVRATVTRVVAVAAALVIVVVARVVVVVVIVAAALVSFGTLAACKDKSKSEGLPPAQEWGANGSNMPSATPGAANPHAKSMNPDEVLRKPAMWYDSASDFAMICRDMQKLGCVCQ